MNDEAPSYPVNSLQLYRLIDHVALAAYDAAQSPEETGETPIMKTANSFVKGAGKADLKRRTSDSQSPQDSVNECMLKTARATLPMIRAMY